MEKEVTKFWKLYNGKLKKIRAVAKCIVGILDKNGTVKEMGSLERYTDTEAWVRPSQGGKTVTCHPLELVLIMSVDGGATDTFMKVQSNPDYFVQKVSNMDEVLKEIHGEQEEIKETKEKVEEVKEEKSKPKVKTFGSSLDGEQPTIPKPEETLDKKESDKPKKGKLIKKEKPQPKKEKSKPKKQFTELEKLLGIEFEHPEQNVNTDISLPEEVDHSEYEYTGEDYGVEDLEVYPPTVSQRNFTVANVKAKVNGKWYGNLRVNKSRYDNGGYYLWKPNKTRLTSKQMEFIVDRVVEFAKDGGLGEVAQQRVS